MAKQVNHMLEDFGDVMLNKLPKVLPLKRAVDHKLKLMSSQIPHPWHLNNVTKEVDPVNEVVG